MAIKIKHAQPNLHIYHSDDITIRVKGYKHIAQVIPYGTDVKGVYFDGYPQIVKKEGSQPIYSVNVKKDIMVPMRDGVRLAVDVYSPDVRVGRNFQRSFLFSDGGKSCRKWHVGYPYRNIMTPLFGTDVLKQEI